MNNDEKSISYAFISKGLNVYTNDDSSFIVSKLCCSDCGEQWYMNLTECFLCGTLNPFLYKCFDCGGFQSITGSGDRCCNSCHSNKLYFACANPECISNTDQLCMDEINTKGGVFDKNSGMLIAQQRCIHCGSQNHEYKSARIIVLSDEDTKELKQIESELVFIIKKSLKNDMKYTIFKQNTLTKPIIETNNFSDIIRIIFG